MESRPQEIGHWSSCSPHYFLRSPALFLAATRPKMPSHIMHARPALPRIGVRPPTLCRMRASFGLPAGRPRNNRAAAVEIDVPRACPTLQAVARAGEQVGSAGQEIRGRAARATEGERLGCGDEFHGSWPGSPALAVAGALDFADRRGADRSAALVAALADRTAVAGRRGQCNPGSQLGRVPLDPALLVSADAD